MKTKLFTTVLLVLLCTNLRGQEEEIETMATDACECLYKIDISTERTKRYKEIKACIDTASLSQQMLATMTGITEKVKDTLSKVEDITQIDSMTLPGSKNVIVVGENYKEIEEHLLRNCPAMEALMTNDEVSSEVSMSDKKKAKKLYDKGMVLFDQASYRLAIGQFEKAVKKDRNFAFAWDMIGYSYRRLEKFEKAIEYYNISLALDPKGRMPLVNKPVAYELMGDIPNAIKGYQNFIAIYPNDPEGYYGIGRLHHTNGDYENALDATMKAFNLYTEMKSPYARDAERNLAIFYNELEKKNQTDLFLQIAKKHNININ